MPMKAIWKNTVIAESDDTISIEGNHYLPRDSVKSGFLRESGTTTECHWKGTASYHSLEVDGETNTDAAWYYTDPKDAAAPIKDRIAFWKGIEIVES
jgi:uncharacterized protein (DUF427 family)